jgi:hypothetical protein
VDYRYDSDYYSKACSDRNISKCSFFNQLNNSDNDNGKQGNRKTPLRAQQGAFAKTFAKTST